MIASMPESSLRICRRTFSLGLVVVVLSAVAGCSGGQTNLKPLTGSNLKKVALIYQLYTQNNNKPLTSEQQLITYAKSLNPDGMMSAGIDVAQVEQYFTSPRDNKPYKIVFKLPQSDPTNPPVVAYEQVGVGGKREVAFLTGNVEEVDEARFRQIVPAR